MHSSLSNAARHSASCRHVHLYLRTCVRSDMAANVSDQRRRVRASPSVSLAIDAHAHAAAGVFTRTRISTACLSIYLSLSACLPVCLPACLSILPACLDVCHCQPEDKQHMHMSSSGARPRAARHLRGARRNRIGSVGRNRRRIGNGNRKSCCRGKRGTHGASQQDPRCISIKLHQRSRRGRRRVYAPTRLFVIEQWAVSIEPSLNNQHRALNNQHRALNNQHRALNTQQPIMHIRKPRLPRQALWHTGRSAQTPPPSRFRTRQFKTRRGKAR